jgi:acetylornithine deacetylase/succinyl-diaminopimelate desuccinylase-like protein
MSDVTNKERYESLDKAELIDELLRNDTLIQDYGKSQAEVRNAIRTLLDFVGLDVDEVVTADVEGEIKDWVEDQLDNLSIVR